MKFKDSMREMKISPRAYFILLLFCVIAFGIVTPAVINFVLMPYLSGPIVYTIYTIPMFIVFVVAIYPLILSSQRKLRSDRLFPMFITELAALSTSEMSFDKIFYILSDKKTYGPLAEDAKKLYRLIKHYNVAAGEACRFVAARTPSVVESDFFSRMAHALEIGDTISRFMKNEHDVIMSEYVLSSESALKDLDFMKEMYTGIVTSLIFVCVFVSIIPLLGTGDITMILYGIVLAFLVMEIVFVYYITTKVPRNPIWYGWKQKNHGGFFTDKDRILMVSVFISLMGVAMLFFLLLPFELPMLLLVSSSCLPLLIPGILISKEEKRIEKRDNIYGAFIRSLGRSSSAAGITMVESVKKLALHKFGPLTDMVRNLSKRLQMHIDPKTSWRHFASESSSHLIERFGDMYTDCVMNGAKPDETSLFISNNMFKILSIRKKRALVASSFFGVLYGVMVSLSFTIWITIGITKYMAEVVGTIEIEDTDMGGSFLNTLLNANFDVQPLEYMAFSVMVIHAFFSAIMLPLLKGGHMATAAIHLISLLWIASASQFIVDILLESLLGI
ncbi:MAG: archaellar assembly protein FlaJ [Methanomassiliicoccales archaeon]|nr:archaellar assembly protein FlaJ [Methanomassiliicoccales archaeon]